MTDNRDSLSGLVTKGRIWSRFKITLLLIVLGAAIAQGQNSTKTGGISFRVDNNPAMDKLASLDSLFTLHQQNFSLAITSWTLPLIPSYVSMLKDFQTKGHEIMDNTPSHATHFFTLLDLQDTALYKNEWGVDHINGSKVCLKYTSVDLTTPHGEGPLNIFGNQIISANPGEFQDLAGNPYYFAIFIPFKNLPYLWYDLRNKNPNDPDSVKINSFWGEPVDLGTHWWFSYKKLTQREVYMHPSAISLLGKRSQKIFGDLGIDAPKSWIQPSGQTPWINAFEIKSNLADSIGYTSGSNFSDAAYFCYNELNSNKTKQFSLQSGDISIENHSFNWNKSKIADAFAKHYVKIDLSYLIDPPGGWNAYLKRVDSLLTWCTVNSIPVRTFSQWSALVYDSLPNRFVNVFPKLNADLDGNNLPDGYDQDTINLSGVHHWNGGVPSSGGACYEIEGEGSICRVTTLGGVEKGRNVFTIWLKRTNIDTSAVIVDFTFPETGTGQSLVFNVDSTEWVMKSLDLSVPDNASLINVLIRNQGPNHDTVKISGMELRSSGFLLKTVYTPQEIDANEQFLNVGLNALVNDTICDPATVAWSVKPADTMNFKVLQGNILQVLKPVSFWAGRDSTYILAESSDGVRDSCYMSFISHPLKNGCSGVAITLTLLDTLSNDIIRWTSYPFDSAFMDTTIYNPTVAPLVTTQYKVICINPLGPVHYDSITLIRNPFPKPSLPPDTAMCTGDSIQLTALYGTHFMWSTGDTSASIIVKPDVTTTYVVIATNEYECSTIDSTIVMVSGRPVVKLHDLRNAYCRNDYASTIYGTPPGGTLGATSGLIGNLFYPDRADTGVNKVWYTYMNEYGCGDTDTVKVIVYDLPHIRPLPDTTLCAGKQLELHAGPGFDNYQWSNGVTDSITVVDSTGHGFNTFPVWVYVTQYGCASKDTAYVQFAPCPGMEDHELVRKFLIFPNPAGLEITIMARSGSSENFSARIIDLKGIPLHEQEFNGIRNKLRVDQLKPGTYLLRIVQGTAVVDYKFIKQ